jgi:hypothetical protein
VYCQLCHALGSSLPLLLTGLALMAGTAHHNQDNILDMVALTDFIHRSKLHFSTVIFLPGKNASLSPGKNLNCVY